MLIGLKSNFDYNRKQKHKLD